VHPPICRRVCPSELPILSLSSSVSLSPSPLHNPSPGERNAFGIREGTTREDTRGRIQSLTRPMLIFKWDNRYPRAALSRGIRVTWLATRRSELLRSEF